MSHAGRRIATAAAAAAAVAVPVIAAASAQADSLPAVGSLPVVGSIAGQSLPLSGLPVAGGVLSGPLSNLPVVGSLTSNLNGAAAQTSAAKAAPMQQEAKAAVQAVRQDAAASVQNAAHHYTPKHSRRAV